MDRTEACMHCGSPKRAGRACPDCGRSHPSTRIAVLPPIPAEDADPRAAAPAALITARRMP